jgi:hypothetical protein
LALLVLCSAVAARTCNAPETAFLNRAGDADWIQAPLPVRRGPWVVDPEQSPTARFEIRPRLERVDADASLEINAWTRVAVEFNGTQLRSLDDAPLEGGAIHIPLAGHARPGANLLRITVRNLRGPPLLRARIDGVDPPVATGTEWRTLLDRPDPPRAILADDTRMPGAPMALPSPASGLSTHRVWWITAFLLGGGAWLARRRLASLPTGRPARAALVLLVLVWTAFFLRALPRVPLWAGPDAVKHVEYVRLLAETGSLPRADEAWAAYHPPLFYALAALPQAIFQPTPDSVPDRALLRLLPALATLGNVLLAWLLAARYLGDASRGARLAAVFAAAVPANLLLASYVSNEALHAFLSNAALVAASLALLSGRASPARLAGVGALLGLAVLTKVTSLLLIPVVAFFAGFSALVVEGRPAGRSVGAALLVAGAALVLCGGWFLRSHALYGQWLLWNHAIPGGEHFWQEPGFRTLGYYTGFGEALRHPYASTFHSFGDALYATFFGDGDTAGVATVSAWRELWNVQALGAAYALALPAAILTAVGLGLLVRDAFRDADPRRRMLATLLLSAIFVIGFALFQRSLALPYYSFVKGSFALGILAPLAVAAGRGMDAAHVALARAHPEWGPAILYGWLAAWIGAVGLGIWG